MRGIVLAAGKGSRLNGTAADRPKCLVELGGVTLIERQIRALENSGVDDIAVVVGCQAERVRDVCGTRATFVENPEFAQTNSLYSLWMARALLYEGFVVLNCDVLFPPVLLEDLLASGHDAALLADYRQPSQPPYGDEEMKVRIRAGRVMEMSKTLPPDQAHAENLGVVKFGPDSAPRVIEILDAIVARGGRRDWAPKAFSAYAAERPLWAIGTRGYPWIEIDFPEDYRRAVREVLPAIDALDEAHAATPAAEFGRGL
ncbi:MAG TPA: phosphocholine cytidylyltransferase family protein [Vicinamibacterales bacterium]|jgi:choline kinase|nr:phosphocholine cytidylyltransferase family protein [Vicinamibacterales bacterium]